MDHERHVIDLNKLSKNDFTELHPSEFWEELGRTVATYGVLEETLAKASFVFSGTKVAPTENIELAVSEWVKGLEKSLSETLGSLINRFQGATKNHPELSTDNIGELCEELRNSARIRNALCHGSWRSANDQGKFKLFYFDQKLGRFEDLVDIQYLQQTRLAVCKLTANVINTVTHMGYSFPGSQSPGEQIWTGKK